MLGVCLHPVAQRVGRAADIARERPIHNYFVKSIECLQFWRYVAKPFVIGTPSNTVTKYEQRVCGFDGACIANEGARNQRDSENGESSAYPKVQCVPQVRNTVAVPVSCTDSLLRNTHA